MLLDDFAELQRRVERAKQDRERAVGARSQLLERLKKNYGGKSLEDAERHLKKKESRERELSEDYAERRPPFDKKYGKILGGQ